MEKATDGFGGNLTVGTAMAFDGTSSDATTCWTSLYKCFDCITPNVVTNSESIPHEVSSFVSGSFGKLAMGAHAYASKSHGVSALSVGNGINNDITAVAGRHDSKKA